MKVCGIIAEYDPFHLGHLYHLRQAKAQSGADFLVCVLGSAFSQRGDAMLFSTRDRARMALENGIDLVLGMPVSFSCAQANRFACGGVGILHRLGIITHLSFGCETDDLSLITAVARLLGQPDKAFIAGMKDSLSGGASFARAQGEALQAALPGMPKSLIAAPNFILAVSYLRELDRLGSDIRAVPVQRRGAYHGTAQDSFASAGAIRATWIQGSISRAFASCPAASTAIMRDAHTHLPDALDKVLLSRLTSAQTQELQTCPEISEGLEKRILAMAREADSRAALLRLVKTKRYPHARINRALSQALLGIKRSPAAPGYARLLGFHGRARPLLRAIAQAGFPLISRPVRSGDPGVALDMRAEELWHLGSGQSAAAAWRQQIVIL